MKVNVEGTLSGVVLRPDEVAKIVERELYSLALDNGVQVESLTVTIGEEESNEAPTIGTAQQNPAKRRGLLSRLVGAGA